VARPALQSETARALDPIEAAARNMMIEYLFGEATAVVIAGTEKKNTFHRFVLGDPAMNAFGQAFRRA
jgi:hypothetical protein